MKFTTTIKPFLCALKNIVPVCSRRSSFEFSKCCMFRCSQGALDIIGVCVGILSAKTTVENVVIIEEGMVCVDAAHMLSVASSLPKEADITFETEPGRLNVTCKRIKSSIPTFDVLEFPTVQLDAPDGQIVMSAEILRTALEVTLKSVSSDMTRPVFTGTLIEVKNSEFRLCSTDGHRLTLFKFPDQCHAATFKPFTIPAFAQQMLIRILGNGDVTIGMSTSGRLFVKHESVTVCIVGIDGEFPDFDQIIQTKDQSTYCARLAKRELSEVMNVVSNFERTDSQNGDALRKVLCNFGEKDVTFSSHSTTRGDVSASCDVDSDGSCVMVAMNGSYIRDALSSILDELVEICVLDPDSPVILHGMDDSRLEQVIMPLML